MKTRTKLITAIIAATGGASLFLVIPPDDLPTPQPIILHFTYDRPVSDLTFNGIDGTTNFTDWYDVNPVWFDELNMDNAYISNRPPFREFYRIRSIPR